jgi:quercetin dioxygenase-like cupin family protein
MSVSPEVSSSLAAEIDKNVAYLKDRQADWGALDFQEKIDPRYKRAQMRYLGTGGTPVKSDSNVIPANHFTLSTMILPAGCIGPSHVHHDVEEAFFVLQGTIKFTWEKDGETVERTLGPRDLIVTPAGVWRALENVSDEEGLMLVMLGTGKPQLPDYPEGSPLTEARKHK